MKFENTHALITSYLDHIEHAPLKKSITSILSLPSTSYIGSLADTISSCRDNHPEINNNPALVKLLETMLRDATYICQIETLKIKATMLIPLNLTDAQKKFLRGIVTHPGFYCGSEENIRQAFIDQESSLHNQTRYLISFKKNNIATDIGYYFFIYLYNYRTSSMAIEHIRLHTDGSVHLLSGAHVTDISDVIKDYLHIDHQPLVTPKPEGLLTALLHGLEVIIQSDASNETNCSDRSNAHATSPAH